MPGLITNYLFGERTYQSLPPNYLKEIIQKNPNAYHLGLQGPDIFFYYLNPYMRKRKNNICNVLHEENTNAFFDNLLEYCVVLKDDEKEICLAYIAGFLCHYALDTHTHPYLFARMQKDLSDHPERRYAASYYRQLETLMDVLLLKRQNHLEPSQLNLEALVFLTKKERRVICDCLLYTVRITYHYRLTRKTMFKVIASVRKTCIFLQTNPHLRGKLVRLVQDRLKVSSSRACFVYPEYQGDPEDYLNEEKQTWYVGEKHVPRDESFVELLNEANLFGNHILEAFDDYLEWHGSREQFIQTIGSMSYYTGESC